tara:strand:+ start:770 stop:1057 length:288 start_codon:yes stop_codon:yes gene_type:complete
MAAAIYNIETCPTCGGSETATTDKVSVCSSGNCLPWESSLYNKDDHCEKCGGFIKWNMSVYLASNPPQVEGKCTACQNTQCKTVGEYYDASDALL